MTQIAASGEAMFIIRWYKKRTYRCRTLILIIGVTGICVFTSLAIFAISDQYRREMDTQRDARAAALLLSGLMGHPPTLQRLAFLAHQTVVSLKLAKIEIRDGRGLIILEEPQGVPPLALGVLAKSEVHLNKHLFFEGDSAVLLPSEEASEIWVYCNGETKRRESLATLKGMGFLGGVFWFGVSIFGYLMTRKTTILLDRLSSEISKVESGESTRINLKGMGGGMLEGLEKLAMMINNLSDSLCLREGQNTAFHKHIAEQMKGRAEKAEDILYSKLLQENKMSTLGMLVSGVMHEINNTNAMIRLEAESLTLIIHDILPILRWYAAEEGPYYLGGMPSDLAITNLVRSVTSLKEQTVRIEEVVKGLREHITGDRLMCKKEVEIASIVTRCKYLLQSQINTVECKMEESLKKGLTVFVNQYEIESVIINLLQNAFRAVKYRGKDGIVSICSHKVDNIITISVTDNGSGIDPEDIPKLCNPFFSRNLENGGTGLGLFISKGILDDHDGTIEFTNGIWSGTTVMLHFPVGGYK